MITFEQAQKEHEEYKEETYNCQSCGATCEDDGYPCSWCGYDNYEGESTLCEVTTKNKKQK
jgi:recombinational DNA repair protein RecR